MSKKNQYVVPTQGGWGVRGEKSDRLTVKTETKTPPSLVFFTNEPTGSIHPA